MKQRREKLHLVLIGIFCLIATAKTALAAADWVPADLAQRLEAKPVSGADDSIKNILIPDYESRIAKLDTSILFVKRHLNQLQDNVIVLYR